MKTPLLALAAAILLFSCAQEAPDELTGPPLPPGQEFRPDRRADDPFQGQREQAVGFYSRGSLLSADLLPAEGYGFVKIHRPRQRGYGTYDMVELLQSTARELQDLYPSRDRIMIGDISDHDGGQISMHSSHQNGLDVDVAFIRKDQTEQDVNDTGGYREVFVKNGKLTDNFDLARNWLYAKVLVRTGRVQRILVNEAVKKGLCTFAKQIGDYNAERETLRRLRVVANHTDHFHIRLTCPEKSPRCQAQVEVPDSPGC